MKRFSGLISHSGGLKYHARSVRYLKTLWASHRFHVESFLEKWNPPRAHLLLIGPSGGYSLPKAWLKKFDQITAIEPDPIARKIFEIRFGIRPHWIKSPLDFHLAFSSEFEKRVSDASSILFCNLLGQLEIQDEVLFKASLRKIYDGKAWASYHDVLSGSGFRFELPPELNTLARKLSLEELKQGIDPIGPSSTIELNAHPAYDLFTTDQSALFQYWEWTLTPNQTQVIEGVIRHGE